MKKEIESARRSFLKKSIGIAGTAGLVLALPVLNGCEETTSKNDNPTAPVNENQLQLDTSIAEYSALATTGSLLGINTTLDGETLKLMVYRVSETEAVTLSRICTHEGCDLRLSSSGELIDADTIQCACHSSRFNLLTGTVEKGPASSSLTAYTTTIDGDIITIQLA